MPKKSLPNIGQLSLDFETCESAEPIISRPLISFAAAFPANHTASQDDAAPVPMSAISGQSFGESFVSLGPDGSWLKTYQGYYQVTMDGSLAEFSETWPRSGTMRSGQCFRRAPWVRHTHENGCSLWPTPQASDWIVVRFSLQSLRKSYWRKRTAATYIAGPRLAEALAVEASCYQTPELTENLMGFPRGWTDLED